MRTKFCTKCNKVKSVNEFGKTKDRKSGINSICKKCKSVLTINYNKTYPWIKIFSQINQRCNNPNIRAYKWYGARGIKNKFKDSNQIKFLWCRDNAHLMKKPSIHRINNDGNYCLANCKFIELSEHIKKHESKSVIQFDKQGNFIKEWDSITDASKSLDIHIFCICSACKNKQKTAGKFIWKYKLE